MAVDIVLCLSQFGILKKGGNGTEEGNQIAKHFFCRV